MITIKSLKEEIEYFKPKTFEFFIEKGLKKECNPYLIIAILIKQKYKNDKLSYHCFNNSVIDKNNDIPFFHKDIPDGFSLFCNKYEYYQLKQFFKRKENIEIRNKKSEKEEIMESEPIPNKKHFICQICKAKFDDYKEHMNSTLHNESLFKYRNSFIKIKATFRRIIDFNEKNKKEITKFHARSDDTKDMDVIELKDNIETRIITYIISDNNNNTTKYDSQGIVLDENKDINKESDKIEIIDLTKEYDENITELDVKDILDILNSIQSNPKIKKSNFRKRKKDDKNSNSFSNENYIYDLKKITGKISYFNSMNRINK